MLNLNINTLSSLRTGSIAPAPLLATVTTASVSNITATGATGGGTISGGTGSVVTEAGVCWSLTPTPTTSSDKATTGATSGSFTVNLTGLTGSTGYYARAYAINAAGTGYGNEVTFNTTGNYYVGQSYGGGIIVYIDGTGEHGLIKGTQLSGSATWGCRGTSISTSTAAGTGSTNTDNIVSVCTTSGIAAELCYNSTLNGYSDWYLPSQGDLGLAFANGFTFPSWSSSQVGGNEAVYGDGGFPGYYQNAQKDANIEVVPFRNF